MNILVVDDEQLICELLEEFLTIKGHIVQTANNGQTAIRQVTKMKPDIVLLDITMPDMTGLEALKQIREIDSSPGIVMLSAFRDEETVQEAMSAGANFYIQKPVELDKLITVLHKWESRKKDDNIE